MGPPAFPHDSPRTPKRAHFRAPALQTPPKFHEKTPRERKRARMGAGEGKKNAHFWASHPSGPPPFGPPSAPHPSGPNFFQVWSPTPPGHPPPRAPTFRCFAEKHIYIYIYILIVFLKKYKKLKRKKNKWEKRNFAEFPPLLNPSQQFLVEALEMKAHSEKSMNVSDAKVIDDDGFLSSSMTIKANNKIMKERTWINRVAQRRSFVT